MPLLDLTKALFAIKDGDQETIVREKIAETCVGLDENLLDAVPAFQDLLSVRVEDDAWAQLDPKQKRTRIFEALRNLLIRLSQEKPLVITIDDLHWSDKTSIEFFDYFIDFLSGVRILLLLLYRPEFIHTWETKSYYNRIGLDQLPLETSAELIKSLLGEGRIVPELMDLILNRAAGNPLFMEELTQTLFENGSIVKQGDQYILEKDLSSVHVPVTVQGIIAARMAFHYSKSDNEEKAYYYLREAGRRAMRNNSAWEAYGNYKEAIAHLKRHPEPEENRKKQLELTHLMLIPMIVLGFPDGSLSFLEEGVNMAHGVGDRKSMIRFYSNMGLYHANRGRHVDWRSCSGKAFEEAEKIHDVESMAQTGPDVCLSYLAEGGFPKAIDIASRVNSVIEDAGRQLDTFGGPTNVYPALNGMRGYSLAVLGKFVEAVPCCENAVQVVMKTENPATIGVCCHYTGWAWLLRGLMNEAVEYFKKGVQHLEEVKFLQPLALAHSGLGLATAMGGDPKTGLRQMEKGLKMHKDAGIEWNLSTHLCHMGICLFLLGDFQKGRDILQQAHQLSRKYNERHTEAKALVWIGRTEGRLSNFDQAENKTNRGLNLLKSLTTKPDESVATLFLGEIFALKGEREEAQKHITLAERLFTEMGMDFWSQEAISTKTMDRVR